jgi:hypothetical protein
LTSRGLTLNQGNDGWVGAGARPQPEKRDLSPGFGIIP